jgi:hypothetical protein
MRQAEISAELRELLELALNAASAYQHALAEWQLGGQQGPRPEPEQERIEQRIKELQADYEALTIAITRTLDEKTMHVEANRRKLIKEADERTQKKMAGYLEIVDQLAIAREELRPARRDALWSRLYPKPEAMAQAPDSLAGGRKKALAPMGVTANVQPERVLDALREDA